MTAGGSVQLRLYRRLRRDGATLMTACVESGLSATEARLVDAEDLKNPPDAACFELLTPAAPSASPQEETTMARPKKQHVVEEVGKPDFALAKKLYLEDIKPAQSRMGEFGQEQSTAFKAIKKRAHIQPAAAKAVFNLVEMEESKRDDFLRSFQGLLNEFGIGIREDLVDTAEGKAAGSVVPIASARQRSSLATLPKAEHPADDSDLNPDDDAPTAEAGDAGDADEGGDDAGDDAGDDHHEGGAEHQQAAE